MLDNKTRQAVKSYQWRRGYRLKDRGIRLDADKKWEEGKHPRAKDGKFTSGAVPTVVVNGPQKSKEYIQSYLTEHPEIRKEIPKYMSVLRDVKQFAQKHPDAEDGTYSATTGKKLNITDGYCVTFHQNNTLEDIYGGYDDDDYAAMCAITKHTLGSDDVYIGYFGNPEVSFHCKNQAAARRFAVEHNQHSVYDVAKDKIWRNKTWNEKTNPIRGLGSN